MHSSAILTYASFIAATAATAVGPGISMPLRRRINVPNRRTNSYTRRDIPPCVTGGNTFPPQTEWPDFEILWGYHLPNINQVDQQTGAHNSDPETARIKSDILSISSQFGTDPRFALGLMMRESIGHTNVKCMDQDSGYPACGLFQNKDGNNPNTKVPDCSTTQPCPLDKITTMIQCGIAGCGLDPNGDWSNVVTAQSKYPGNYGAMARWYNTGRVPNINDLRVVTYTDDKGQNQTAGIPYYAQDVANLIMGHTTDETFTSCQN